MTQKTISKKYIFIFLLILGSLISGNFVLAQIICPSQTTVEGQNVTFVGELTDTGGETTSVWFDYGQTIAYGLRTSERILGQEGRYCITVPNLLPCTTYHYRAAARNSAGSSFGENRTFTTRCSVVSVDLRANHSDGPIIVSHNSSATLSWTTSNATSCHASGGWSGVRSVSGSQSTGNLISSQTFTLSCTGPGGTSSDSVTVNIAAPAPIPVPAPTILTVNKLVRNLSDGTGWLDQVSADPDEKVSFLIQIRNTSQSPARNVVVRDILPAQIIYRENLKINDISRGGDIISGLNIGEIIPGQLKTITFEAQVASEGRFSYGDTNLISTVTVHNPTDYNPGIARTDTAKIVVNKRAVAGVATEIRTGIVDRALDYILLPFAVTFIITLVFKNYFILLSGWLEKRKNEMLEYRVKRTLRRVISKIKVREKLS